MFTQYLPTKKWIKLWVKLTVLKKRKKDAQSIEIHTSDQEAQRLEEHNTEFL